MMVFSSTWASICSTSMQYLPGDIGISRISMSQYLANLCHTTCTGPHTMLGVSVGLPAASPLAPATATWRPCRRACTPPTSRWPSTRRRRRRPGRSTGRPASARTAARSRPSGGTRPCRSCSCSMDRSMSWWTSGSSQVWQKVARFWRALPSSISSSEIAWKASSGRIWRVGEPVGRQGGRRSVAGVDRVEHLVADGLALVKGHVPASWSVGMVMTGVAGISGSRPRWIGRRRDWLTRR